MNAPRVIQRDLSLINPDYFAWWNPMIQRWQIRTWRDRHYRGSRADHEAWRRSDVMLTVRREDETGVDIGYQPLDGRAVLAVKAGLFWARNVAALLRSVDEANENLGRQYDADVEYISRYTAKKIWHFYQEPTVYLGGTHDRLGSHAIH